MNRARFTEISDYEFNERENERIDDAVRGLIVHCKVKNLTFAEATEALLRCKVLLGNEKIN